MLIRLAHHAGSLGVLKRGAVRFPVGSSVSAGGMGMVRDYHRWNVAFTQYDSDQVKEAFQTSADIGVGLDAEYAEAFALIDAEHITSDRSDIIRINQWLEVERIPGESALDVEQAGDIAQSSIATVFSTIGLRLGMPVLVTILEKDVVLPEHLDDHGYVAIKKPYAKYCLPWESASSAERFEIDVQSLAACHAAGVISNEQAAPWLISATQAVACVSVSDGNRLRFCSGQLLWVNPSTLNARLQGMRVGNDQGEDFALARAQSILVGRYLLAKKKVADLRECLAYHSPRSAFHYLKIQMSNDPTRDICKKVYGFAPEYLFEQALAATCRH